MSLSLTPVANLPPVSLTTVAICHRVSSIPVVHLDLQNISGIFEIRNDPNFIFTGLGEVIHEQNLKQKIS
jgi:hypothetical protein